MIYRQYLGLHKVGQWIIILLVCIGCSPAPKSHSRSKLHITTTISTTASLIESIGDSLVDITTLLPQGNTPEHYEPTPQDMQSLSESDAYLYVGGLGFEGAWLGSIRDMNPKLSLVNLSEGFEGASCTDHTHGDHYHVHADGGDPHYWTGIRGIRHMARRTYEALCNLDSAHVEVFRSKYELLSKEIDDLERTVRQKLTRLSSKAFVIYHPSLTDFASEFGLEQLVIERDGKEPSAQQLKSLIDQARAREVQVVFVQQEFSPHITQSIARELGAREVVINPLGADWKTELLSIVQALTML